MLVIGVGCRKGTSGAAILAAIGDALAAIGEDRPIACLATAAFKHDEAGIADAARHLGVPLHHVEEAELDAVAGAASETVRRHVGIGAVATPAALVAAGPGARLLAPRVATAGITCAIAEPIAAPGASE